MRHHRRRKKEGIDVKKTRILVVLLVVLAIGAELALGGLGYAQLRESAKTLSAMRQDNESLREDNAALQEALGGLREELSQIREDFDKLKELAGESEDVAQEDDVKIANEYTIRSTLPISDAYHSGDRSGLDDKQKETLDMASEVLEQIIQEDMDDYEKEQAVYLWMTKNLSSDNGLLLVIPNTQADCDNPYGVLKYHNAVCVGYATTFRLFMQMLDIPCMVVHNSERYHSWDLVQLNGGWYHTDIYSDAGQGDFSHFNLTDSMQQMSQSWNQDFFPAATSAEFCYAVRESKVEKDIYHVPAALRKALDDRDSLLALRFEEDFGEKEAQIVQEMLNNVQNRLDYSDYGNELYMHWSWMPAEKGWLVAISLNWYEQGCDDPEPEIKLPDEAYEQLNQAVEDAFGDIESGGYDENEDLP